MDTCKLGCQFLPLLPFKHAQGVDSLQVKTAEQAEKAPEMVLRLGNGYEGKPPEKYSLSDTIVTF